MPAWTDKEPPQSRVAQVGPKKSPGAGRARLLSRPFGAAFRADSGLGEVRA